jgi:hypothetical protein
VDVLRAAFVVPSRFGEALRGRGIHIIEGEATGVATRRTLELEAVRLNIPADRIRDVVREATGRIVKMGGYPELSPPNQILKLFEIKRFPGRDRMKEKVMRVLKLVLNTY